jgi:hypothetical protein
VKGAHELDRPSGVPFLQRVDDVHAHLAQGARNRLPGSGPFTSTRVRHGQPELDVDDRPGHPKGTVAFNYLLQQSDESDPLNNFRYIGLDTAR